MPVELVAGVESTIEHSDPRRPPGAGWFLQASMVFPDGAAAHIHGRHEGGSHALTLPAASVAHVGRACAVRCWLGRGQESEPVASADIPVWASPARQ